MRYLAIYLHWLICCHYEFTSSFSRDTIAIPTAYSRQGVGRIPEGHMNK